MKKAALILSIMIPCYCFGQIYTPVTNNTEFIKLVRFDSIVRHKSLVVYASTIDSAGCVYTIKNWNTPTDSTGNQRQCGGAAGRRTDYEYSGGAWNITYSRQ